MNLKDIKARNLTAKAPLLAYTEFTEAHRNKFKYQAFAVATDPADAGDGIDTGMTTSTSSTCSFLRQVNRSDRSKLDTTLP